MEKNLYHITRKEKLNDIMTNGIIPKNGLTGARSLMILYILRMKNLYLIGTFSLEGIP